MQSISINEQIIPREPYCELPNVLKRLSTELHRVIDNKIIGIYLVGSLATGDFDIDSDVDFLVVINAELNDYEVSQVEDVHKRIFEQDCYPAKHLEGSYISNAVLNNFENVGKTPIWYIDNGSTSLEESTHDNQWNVRWVLRERGIALFGPNPIELLPPIPLYKMRVELIDSMKSIERSFEEVIDEPLSFFNSRFGQSFTVLTICRILQTLKTGKVQSKLDGMKWAIDELDPSWHSFIRQAWKEREGVRFCIKIKQLAQKDILLKTLDFVRYGINKSQEIERIGK